MWDPFVAIAALAGASAQYFDSFLAEDAADVAGRLGIILILLAGTRLFRLTLRQHDDAAPSAHRNVPHETAAHLVISLGVLVFGTAVWATGLRLWYLDWVGFAVALVGVLWLGELSVRERKRQART